MRQERRRILGAVLEQPEVRLVASSPTKTYRITHRLYSATCASAEVPAAKQEVERRKSAFSEKIQALDWAECLRLLRPKYRVNFLNAIRRRCTLRTFCRLLRLILTDGSQLKPEWTLLHRTFQRLQAGRAVDGDYLPHIMSPGELRRFQDLPDEVEVWRGSGDTGLGWTWTLDRFTARWFASHYAQANLRRQGFVHKARVKKDQILALLSDSPVGQETVIVDPSSVTVVSSKTFGVECRFKSPEERYRAKSKVGATSQPDAPVEQTEPLDDEESQALARWVQECLEEQGTKRGFPRQWKSSLDVPFWY